MQLPKRMMPLLALLFPAALALLTACRIPEHRQEFYANGALKERFWVYERDGHEVMHGLYVAYYPNGYREIEILYRDGAEVSRTYFTERGTVKGRVQIATVPEP